MPIDQNDLRAVLDTYNANALVAMATFHRVLPEKGRNKTLLIDQILKQVTNPAEIKKSVENLSKLERAALDAIMRRDGQASVRNIRAELAGLQLIDPAAKVEFGEYSYNLRPDPQAKNSRRLEDILARLNIFGLVFPQEALTQGDPGYGYQVKRTFYDASSSVFIPPKIRIHLPEPAPLPEKVERIAQVDHVQEGSARVFQRDLYLYWSYVRDSKPGLTQKDEITKAALKEINGLLLVREEIKTGETENDYVRLRFLRGILTALKLIEREKNFSLVTSGNTDFFSLTPDERVKRTYETWLETDQFSELFLLPADVRPRSTSSPLIPAKRQVVQARKYVLEQVRKMIGKTEVQGWTALEGLVNRVYTQDYEFFLKRQPVVTNPYYGYNALNHPYDYSTNELMLTFHGINSDEVGWQKVEANLIRGVVEGPLYWMGLVDLGYQKKETPAAFRLTTLGAWLFRLGPKPQIPVEGGRVIVQPNLHVMALDPIQDAVLAALDQFCERLSAERAVEYRLTRASVYAGQKAGWEVPKIKETLEKLSGAALPGNVARTLDEWQAQYERITIHPQVALIHGDPAVIDQITQGASNKGWVAARPLPELARLRSEKGIQKVAQYLREKEILPVINARAKIPTGAVTCTADGAIHFTTRTPSLYLHGHLVAFADPVSDGYRITHGSVQRAVRAGLTAPEILQRLEAVHSGPLPEALARDIRAWTRHYGSAGLAPVTLLQMRDAETLEELLADPEVGPLIKRFTPKQPKALAAVAPEDVETLRRLLADRGVDLSGTLE